MKHIQTCKAIRMDYDTEKFLNRALEVLQTLNHELDAIIQEDDYYSGLESECWAAWSALEDFINSFKVYAKGEDN